MIVTIDGPAGSGKSSSARAVADELGFRYLESGAFYRGLTLAALRAGISPEHWDGLDANALDALAVHAVPGERGFRILAGAEDISSELRSPAVNARVSAMARVPAVRAWLLDSLRSAARGADLVAEGRDMGTVVFPDADVKIFLTANLETRARRRLGESGDADPALDALAAEEARLAERDRVDRERSVAPLRAADDAIHVDTTGLSFEAQVARIVALVRAARRA
ncbi:MAG: (d)CMP kinase [Gemmatimonadetes bacterium]|nr:(d)CMP kinase [Gemmatimonadota bacterium]